MLQNWNKLLLLKQKSGNCSERPTIDRRRDSLRPQLLSPSFKLGKAGTELSPGSLQKIDMGKKKPQVSPSALVQGFVLTLKTEEKALFTIGPLQDKLPRFPWHANQKGWPDDIQAVDTWQIRELLGYMSTAYNRSPTSPNKCRKHILVDAIC